MYIYLAACLVVNFKQPLWNNQSFVKEDNLNTWLRWLAACKSKSHMTNMSKRLETPALDVGLYAAAYVLGVRHTYMSWKYVLRQPT
jgi:hypothetical protein